MFVNENEYIAKTVYVWYVAMVIKQAARVRCQRGGLSLGRRGLCDTTYLLTDS